MKLAGLHAIQATTVRADLTGRSCSLGAGTGRQGDVVAARVTDPGGLSALIDWQQVSHPVREGTILIGILANRDSTTHASGGIPPAGIPITAGSQLAWLGGQSGLLGIQDWSPSPGNTHGAQATGTVEALGLVHDRHGVVNIAALARAPRAAPAPVPILVVCGTSAEVGKTTIAARIISALTRQGRTVVAVKPTGSGGIADSLAHRQAGAAATYDLIDCGLPSSYTDPDVFAARIGRCLAYAAEHTPDAVVCELGGDVIWGNNDIFLGRPEVRPNLTAVLCIAGDAAGALGVHAFLHREGLGDLPLTYAPAYTRNPHTFATRLRCHLGAQVSVLDEDPAEWSSRLLPTPMPGRTIPSEKAPRHD